MARPAVSTLALVCALPYFTGAGLYVHWHTAHRPRPGGDACRSVCPCARQHHQHNHQGHGHNGPHDRRTPDGDDHEHPHDCLTCHALTACGLAPVVADACVSGSAAAARCLPPVRIVLSQPRLTITCPRAPPSRPG